MSKMKSLPSELKMNTEGFNKMINLEMEDPAIEVAIAPLRQFILRNRTLNSDEKTEAYTLLLDLVVDVIQFTSHKNLERVRSTFLD